MFHVPVDSKFFRNLFMKQRFYMLWSACGISLCLVTATSTVEAQSIKIDGTTPAIEPENLLGQTGKPVLIAKGEVIDPPPIRQEFSSEVIV
jgi:hypothetical protein